MASWSAATTLDRPAACSSVKFKPHRLQKIASGGVGVPHLAQVVGSGEHSGFEVREGR